MPPCLPSQRPRCFKLSIFDPAEISSRARLCPDGDTALHQSWIRVTHSKPPGPIKPSWLSLLAEATKNQGSDRVVRVGRHQFAPCWLACLAQWHIAAQLRKRILWPSRPGASNQRDVGLRETTVCRPRLRAILLMPSLRCGRPHSTTAWTLEQQVDSCFVSSSIVPRHQSPANFQRTSIAPGSSTGPEPPNRAAVVLSLRDDQAATVAPLLSVREDSSTLPTTNNPNSRFLKVKVDGKELLLEIAVLQRRSTFPSCCISLSNRPKTCQYHQANKH